MKIVKKNDKNILTLKRAKNGVEYLSFDALEKYDNIVQGFSTKIGGVLGVSCSLGSSGICHLYNNIHKLYGI